MASSPITSWQINGKKVEILTDFIFLGSKITADGNCSHEIKRCLLLGRKAVTNLDSALKNRDITLSTKVRISESCGGSSGKGPAGSAGDPGLIPGLGRYPRGEMVTHYSILAWRITWTQEPGRLQLIAEELMLSNCGDGEDS